MRAPRWVWLALLVLLIMIIAVLFVEHFNVGVH